MHSEQDKREQEAVLARHLEHLLGHCRDLVSSSEAVILYGSYARGEGSWYRDERGEWCPYNDYDLLIISNHRVREEALTRARRVMAEEVGLRWVDVSVMPPWRLNGLAPTVFNFDLKYGSKVIQGDDLLTERMPAFRADDIPLREVMTLILTRAYTFLGSLDGIRP